MTVHWRIPMLPRRGALSVSLVLSLLCLAGCPGSVYMWEVVTESTQKPPSFTLAAMEREPMAILEATTSPGLYGNEIGLALSLKRVVQRMAPNMRLVSPQEAASRMNRQGLAAEYARMRMDYAQSNILDRDTLRKIGAALGVRYVFQPRLAAFTQTLYDRWEVPALQINVLRTRVSILRLALQLWDTETGDLVWASTAEGAFQEEAFTDEPVYLREAGRITWGSIMSDFAHGKTASQYTPANNLLDSLIGPGNVDEDATSHHPATGAGGK
jgi:hypothetical protein